MPDHSLPSIETGERAAERPFIVGCNVAGSVMVSEGARASPTQAGRDGTVTDVMSASRCVEISPALGEAFRRGRSVECCITTG